VSAVGFAAVFHGGDFECASGHVKADAVVADAEAELRGLDTLETLDIAFPVFKIVGQGAEYAEGGGLIDGSELSFGLLVPDNLFAHAQRSTSRESSGVRPIRSKSSKVSPNSASTFS